MDAILSLIRDPAVEPRSPARTAARTSRTNSHSISMEAARALPRTQKRDILLMAAVYDNDRDLAAKVRFDQLSSKLRVHQRRPLSPRCSWASP